MRFLFAPDAFKGSLSAEDICALLTDAARAHYPDAVCDSIPVADGGEGTVRALVRATGGTLFRTMVTGPMGIPTEAVWGVLGDGRTAVLEVAEACGLPLVPAGMRNPLYASSCGAGELLAHVLSRGYREILIGLGGSATNDGGMGLLCALGARFADAEGAALPGRGESLGRVASVDLSGLPPQLAKARLTALSDVTNPLLGETGATAVYGPQKGVTPAMGALLEAGMARYADMVEQALGARWRDMPGAGAAGGLGMALGGVLGAAMRPGIETVLEVVGFDARVAAADLVVTGEGRMDGQSIAYGKVVAGVATRCAAHGVPVVAIVGGMAAGAEALYGLAEASIVTTVNGVMALGQAMADAEALFASAADRMFRLLKIGQGLAGQAPEA